MSSSLIKKYTTKNRVFKFSPDAHFLRVYINGCLNGFIWNCDKIICIDGERIAASEFFK